MSKTHTEKDRERERERERECWKGQRWECCVVSCLTTCDRPVPSHSSYSADVCCYVELITPFLGSDFMKERIKFHESMKIKIDLNHCLSLVSKSWFLSFLKECRLYSCGNVDGKPSAG